MKRPLDLLDQVRGAVEAHAGPEAAKVTGFHGERLACRRGRRTSQASAQRVVDYIPESATGSPGQRLQLGGDVFIQRERGAHVLMLLMKHHDVNA